MKSLVLWFAELLLYFLKLKMLVTAKIIYHYFIYHYEKENNYWPQVLRKAESESPITGRRKKGLQGAAGHSGSQSQEMGPDPAGRPGSPAGVSL